MVLAESQEQQSTYERVFNPNEDEQRVLAKKTILNMQRFIINRIAELEQSNANDEEKRDFSESIDALQERFIEQQAKENPLLETVWQEVNQSYHNKTIIPDLPNPEQEQAINHRVETRANYLSLRETLAPFFQQDELKQFNTLVESAIGRM